MDERSNNRVATDTIAEFAIEDRYVDAKVWDLSVSGCKLQVLDKGLKVGDNCTIRFDMGVHAKGTVVWRERDFAGVRLVEHLHEAVIRHLDLARLGKMSLFELPSLPRSQRGQPAVLSA